METALISPAKAAVLGIPTVIFSVLIPVIGIALFTYIMAKRVAPLIFANPDYRFDRIGERLVNVAKLWLGQWKQPRYRTAGIVHIMLFAGFIILSIRSSSLVIIGISEGFVLPGLGGTLGHIYNVLKDYAATMVLIAAFIAAYRRAVVKPARYAVPEKYGKDHTGEALFVLAMIAGLMISESLFEASAAAAAVKKGMHAEFIAPLSLGWIFKTALGSASIKVLQVTHVVSYYIHDLIFFSFLCFLPLGKHFHVITSLFNVYFMKLDKGSVKPVKWGITDEKLDELESFGVKNFEDFTWKHMLDFYSCADCGRCSDQCPANAVGRPLSPRFISIKAREYSFSHYPLKDKFKPGEPLVGSIFEEDEIWSCTTCGACEEECPVMIEYIDKIVDLRRGLVDEGNVPQSLQKPLKAIEKRGNPWGKMEKKRAEWAADKEFKAQCQVKLVEKGETADVLFFPDSISSYDDRIQEISKSTARVLKAAGIDFAILGKLEKDSGHEVRRFGEEMLFQTLKEENTANILESGAKTIVTSDPHAYNAFKKDYKGLPPVKHISEIIAEAVKSGRISLKNIDGSGKIYTYHDPCYLGRHNGMYDIPREVLDAIPGIQRVEMTKSRDRSFCCGGGGLMLFYEPVEEQRMGQLRVEMAKEAGANVIVTACPFCMVNMEDAIKTSGLEGQMEAIDLVELIDRHL
ncbi:ETF:quinone oxidoreductase [Desulfonema limicola]|uniref:ETF:quinone oxidoreductase n=1 Tax=Desulfonema limicola TaxID=45656 RepID=A0A975B9K1_9BACT|nr:(Fe-S)-binding protein [Desulfonema limicola]QTA81378.1 ETF:quinone oxidoreductase [Desulfonema limicola]